MRSVRAWARPGTLTAGAGAGPRPRTGRGRRRRRRRGGRPASRVRRPAVIVLASGTGRLGSVLTAALTRRGLAVRVLTRDPARAAHLTGPGVEVATGDVRDRASLATAVRGARVVVSAVQGFAGSGGVSPTTVDRQGNINLIDPAHGRYPRPGQARTGPPGSRRTHHGPRRPHPRRGPHPPGLPRPSLHTAQRLPERPRSRPAAYRVAPLTRRRSGRRQQQARPPPARRAGLNRSMSAGGVLFRWNALPGWRPAQDATEPGSAAQDPGGTSLARSRCADKESAGAIH